MLLLNGKAVSLTALFITLSGWRAVMLVTNQREIAGSQLERNQRREAEVQDALKQERVRHEAAVNNMHRLRALLLARDAKSIDGAMSAPDSSKLHGR
jgi:hypothetical protein